MEGWEVEAFERSIAEVKSISIGVSRGLRDLQRGSSGKAKPERPPKYAKLAPISQKVLQHEFSRFRAEHGSKHVAKLKPHHVEALIAEKGADRPAAANRLLKLLRRLCGLAFRKGVWVSDPSMGIERYAENPDGYHPGPRRRSGSSKRIMPGLDGGAGAASDPQSRRRPPGRHPARLAVGPRRPDQLSP